MKMTLMITSLNELEGMKVILPRIRKEWVDEIIIIDGHSTDGSVEYAQSLGFKVMRQRSKGLQGAYKEVVEVAQGDVIIPFSPDGNSLPERIPELVAKMREGYDMVTVSRYLGDAKSEDDTFFTALGNWGITMMINTLFNGHYTDSLVMFRAWKKELVGRFCIDTSIAGFEPQLAIECARHKATVAEIPGDEPARIHGGRKVHLVQAGFSILYLIMRKWFSHIGDKFTADLGERSDDQSEIPKTSSEINNNQ